MVKMDNIAISYFQSQNKLSPEQARWYDFLVEFDYVSEYKSGRVNMVADALSYQHEQDTRRISHTYKGGHGK